MPVMHVFELIYRPKRQQQQKKKPKPTAIKLMS